MVNNIIYIAFLKQLVDTLVDGVTIHLGYKVSL